MDIKEKMKSALKIFVFETALIVHTFFAIFFMPGKTDRMFHNHFERQHETLSKNAEEEGFIDE